MKCLWIHLLFLIPQLLAAQSKQDLKLIGEADDYFSYERYSTALNIYEEINQVLPENAHVSYQMAECHRLMFQYADAERYYEKTSLLAGASNPMSFYYLGLMQKFNGNYDGAIKSFDKFLDLTDGTGRYPLYTEQAFIEQAGARNALEDKAASPYEAFVLPGPVNSPFNDFASAHNQESVILTSGRTGRGRNLDARYGEAFTDLYYFSQTDGGWTDLTRDRIRHLNHKYNDGTGSYSRDGRQFYYTVCGDDREECLIYLSRADGQNWSDPEPLNDLINLPGYDAKQPVVSMTGDTLFFVSDRPGGMGGNDIWMSIRTGGNSWGPPVNLGPSVNTKLNEVSPRTTALPNILMFSSNGHQGYGGYDLFMARRLSDGDTSLINIGVPFNSSYDELYPELHLEEFFWSSNRPEGQGGFDIYAAQTGKPLKFLSRLSLLNRSAKRSDVNLHSRKPSEVREDLFTLVMEDKLEYDQLSREDKALIDRLVREGMDESLLSHLSDGKKNSLLSLARRRRQLLENAGRRLFETTLPQEDHAEAYDITGNIVAADGEILGDIRLYLKNEAGEIMMIAGVSDQGNFRYSHIAPGKKVHITADPFIYDQVEKLAVEQVQIQPITTRIKKAESIFFDLDQSVLRGEATAYLTFLLEQLRLNPAAQIEIFAYADNSGSQAYNLKLTQKRGQSVFDFLVSEGIQGNQLMIRPQGQEYPEGVDQSPLGRQKSRRVEFVIHGMNQFADDKARFCFTREAITWESLAEQTGVELAVLEVLNVPDQTGLRSVQPVRFPDARVESASGILDCQE